MSEGAIREREIDVTVVVPSWNTRDLLRACLSSVAASGGPGLELATVVVDDASSDGSAAMVADEFPGVELVRLEHNVGFTRACNVGLERARGRHVLLLNADTELRPGALSKLVARLDGSPEHAAAAPRLVNPDGSLQAAHMGLPRVRTALCFGTPLESWFPREMARYHAADFDYERGGDVEQPPAACLLLRRAALDRVGVLDEDLRVFFSDVDLCVRLRDEGFRIAYEPAAEVLHHLGRSTAQLADFLSTWHGDRLTYYRRHFGYRGALAAKLGAALAWLGFAGRQAARRVTGRAAEPVAPAARALTTLLRR